MQIDESFTTKVTLRFRPFETIQNSIPNFVLKKKVKGEIAEPTFNVLSLVQYIHLCVYVQRCCTQFSEIIALRVVVFFLQSDLDCLH